MDPKEVWIWLVLHCPNCGMQHLDVDEWRTKPHRTHLCVDGPFGTGCGALWRPSIFSTVGVLATELGNQPVPPRFPEAQEAETIKG